VQTTNRPKSKFFFRDTNPSRRKKTKRFAPKLSKYQIGKKFAGIKLTLRLYVPTT